MKNEKGTIVLAGGVIGLIAAILVFFGNPANMGFCIACFLRDTTGALGLHSAAAVQYIRPEIIGLVLGACIISLAKKEFRPRGGSAPVTRFTLGAFVLLAIASPLIEFYHLSPEASSTAWELIVCHTVCAVVFWPSSFTLPNALRAAGDVKFTMLTSIVSMWIFRIGLSYVLGAWLQLGVLGVWIAMTVDWVFRAALFIQRFLREKWKHRQVI